MGLTGIDRYWKGLSATEIEYVSFRKDSQF